MTINTETIALVKEYEGLVLKAYPDPGSKDGNPWTIGYGHTKNVKRGDVITQAQAEVFLKADLEATVQTIKQYVKAPLNDNQYGALASFIFNVGETAFKKSSVLSYINAGKLDSVPGRLALYRLNDGKVMAGLVRRRTAEGTLWMKPVDGVASIEGSAVPASPAITKKPIDLGTVGTAVTLGASLSGDVRTIIGNVTELIGINPVWLLLAIGLGFAAWTVYKRVSEK